MELKTRRTSLSAQQCEDLFETLTHRLCRHWQQPPSKSGRREAFLGCIIGKDGKTLGFWKTGRVIYIAGNKRFIKVNDKDGWSRHELWDPLCGDPLGKVVHDAALEYLFSLLGNDRPALQDALLQCNINEYTTVGQLPAHRDDVSDTTGESSKWTFFPAAVTMLLFHRSMTPEQRQQAAFVLCANKDKSVPVPGDVLERLNRDESKAYVLRKECRAGVLIGLSGNDYTHARHYILSNWPTTDASMAQRISLNFRLVRNDIWEELHKVM